MTQHLCQRLLNVPHAALLSNAVGCQAQTDAGQKVLLFTSMFLFSCASFILPSSVCIQGRQAPSCFSRTGWSECDGRGKKRAGGFAETEGCGGSEPNKLCWEATLSLFPFFSPHQVVCCLVPPAHLKCHSASPGQSPHVTQNAYQHKANSQTRAEDKEFGKQASYITVDFCSSCTFKITLKTLYAVIQFAIYNLFFSFCLWLHWLFSTWFIKIHILSLTVSVLLVLPFLSPIRCVCSFLCFVLLKIKSWASQSHTGPLRANLRRLLANLHVRSISLYRGSIFGVSLFLFSCLPCYLHHS